MADRDCYNYHLQTSKMAHNHLLHTGSVILAWGRQTPFHDWRTLIVWRFKSGLKSIITISTRSIISRFKLELTQTWPGGWWRHKNLTAGVSCRGGPIKWTRWLLVSRISWDALSLSQETSGVRMRMTEAGDVWPSRGLSSLSSLLDTMTPMPCPVWIQYTLSTLYADTRPVLSLIPDPGQWSHWSQSYHEALSLAGAFKPLNTSQQEMSQAAYNNSIANLTNNTLKIMFLKSYEND